LVTFGYMLRNFCVAPAAKIMEYIACYRLYFNIFLSFIFNFTTTFTI